MMSSEDAPDTLREAHERKRREDMLTEPHVGPLTQYLEALKRRYPQRDMPHFDPCDGGIYARALFLLEAPGPKAVGSTFISRNNPDSTARNMWHLMNNAGIPRRDVVLWNIVPWYVGDGKHIRAVNQQDIREALPHLKGLLELLPQLRLIVLVGKKSQSARAEISRLTSVPIIETYHMSQQVVHVWPEKHLQTQEKFHAIARLLKEE